MLKRSLVLGLIAAIGLGIVPVLDLQAAPLRQTSGNLVNNPGFEGAFGQVDSKTQVGAGWTNWWIPTPAGQPDYLYMQPTYEPSSNCSTTCEHRIHSGGNAQRMFQLFGAYKAGLYQQVTVPANADLRFTMWGQGWSSTSDNPENVSVGGSDMQMKIGIDPLGGTNPLDPRVQWSEQFNALDSWHQFTAYAKAQGTTVTIFAYANPFDTRRKNEVYWDDAELVALSGELAATAQAIYPTPTSIPASQLWTPTPVSVSIGQNLLIDGGFEGKLYIPCSKAQDVPWHHISCEGLDFEERLPNGKRANIMWNTVQVPIGWKGWWLTPNNNHGDPNYYSNHPANCYEDAPEGCTAWHNPEYRDTKGIAAIGPSRIRSGSNSQKYFTFWSVHEAGVMQTVSVPAGTTVRFSVYMHAWSSNQDMSELDPSTFKSRGQTSMHMRVGIDPTGGDDPWSPNVVWSPEHDSYDNFGYYEVRAVAQADKVTVYTHSMPEKGMKHNDVYVDDAELVVIDGATAFSPAPAQPDTQPAAAPNVPAAARPTALPRPDGSIVHVVQSGDTVFGLALQYDVSMDSILQLNGLTKESYLQIGQELVIAGATVPPAAPTSAPSPATTVAAPASTPTPVAIAKVSNDTTEPSRGLLCVRAFEDTNSDGLYDERNALMQGATFNVINAQGQTVVSYESDGVSEPHCFTRLQPGNYTVSIDPSADMVATSDRKWSVTLVSGSTIDVNFGARLQAAAAQPPAGTATNAESGSALGLAFIVIIAGAGLLMYARRRTGVSRA